MCLPAGDAAKNRRTDQAIAPSDLNFRAVGAGDLCELDSIVGDRFNRGIQQPFLSRDAQSTRVLAGGVRDC